MPPHRSSHPAMCNIATSNNQVRLRQMTNCLTVRYYALFYDIDVCEIIPIVQ